MEACDGGWDDFSTQFHHMTNSYQRPMFKFIFREEADNCIMGKFQDGLFALLPSTINGVKNVEHNGQSQDTELKRASARGAIQTDRLSPSC